MEKLIIKIPRKNYSIEIAEMDFPEELNWKTAEKNCIEKGEGWRMPELMELEHIFKAIKKLKAHNFNADFYWSSTEFYMAAYYFNFRKGYSTYIVKGHKNALRMVRTITKKH
jgi:hypothetical protein